MAKKIFVISTSVLLVFALSLAAGFYWGNRITDKNNLNSSVSNSTVEKKEEIASAAKTLAKITPSTIMVYEYYYADSGETEKKQYTAPYFMTDLTLKDLEKYYSDWEVTYFSAQKVIMRKTVYDEKNQRYIVSTKDGYVAVFYETDHDGTLIKDMTDISVSALPDEERERLEKGIHVLGNESLMRIMEDYSS